MRTRNSGAPKSPPPAKKTPPARKPAAKASTKTPTVPTPDSGAEPRVTKRQAAIKAKQAKIGDTAPPPKPQLEDDDDDASLGDDANEVTAQMSPEGKVGARKGTKRARGSAKGKAPAAQKAKLVESEEMEEEKSISGNEDIEMIDRVIEIRGKGDIVTDEIEDVNDNKEDAPSETVTYNEELTKEATETDHLVVNNASEPSDARAEEEREKKAVEMEGHLAGAVEESGEAQKDDTEVETFVRLGGSEGQNKIASAMEQGTEAGSKVHIVDETASVLFGEKSGWQPASTEEHTYGKTLDKDTKAESTIDLTSAIIKGADEQRDQDGINESKVTNAMEVSGDPEGLADMDEDILDEVARKDNRIVDMDGEDGDSRERNFEVCDVECVETLTVDNDSTHEDVEEVKIVEGDEERGNGIDFMVGEGKKDEKDVVQGITTLGVVESFKGPESDKNQGDNVVRELGEKRDELKVVDNLERGSRDSVGDGEKFDEEHREWTAVAKERRIKKEHEIFVRGLGGDTKEDDLRKVFKEVGEVVEVRLHTQLLSNKDKGYAFVRFADKEHVKRALTEIKDPIIGGLTCRIGPSEDNDTLFLGNICNTWTKEAIKQKLKDYGVEGVENITLVPDAQRDGFSRGFAFLEFSCHDDAVAAYQRLQKPDVIFGHAERTVKVAFAEPLRDPDPDVMLKVKAVFVDGLPAVCDEIFLREKVKGYGEIERIVLARNMTTAKRKDFGFIHFTTHEAAVACIDGINNTGLDDGIGKTKVKARLSNPLPKTQAVKGGMAGGFRIGFSSGGGASKLGKGIGREGNFYRQGDSARGRGSYQRGYGQPGRAGLPGDSHLDTRFPSRVYGQGSMGGFRPRGELPMVNEPFMPNHVRPMSVPGGPMEPFGFEGEFGRQHNQRQIHDSYAYGHRVLGNKRPSYATDLDAGYMEPSRRPHLNYADPYPITAPYSSHGIHFRDPQGPPSDIRPHNYYGPPANPHPHDFYGPPASARPHEFYANPSSARPHNYYGPLTSTRPPEYYRPPANNIRPNAHSRPDYRGWVRPLAFRGNPAFGGGFHY